jgi:NTP pyrophosphatase (non-canonical NTP hydrolase)
MEKINLTNEFEPIRNWAQERGIYEKGDAKTQFLKLIEEIGELSKSILKNDEEEFIDAIGDCVVVLTNLAALNGKNIEDCINSAYEVISKRKGKMINGTFVKD